MTGSAEEYKTLPPEVRFDVHAGGAGKGMTDMLAGAADIAMLGGTRNAQRMPNALEARSPPRSVEMTLVTSSAREVNYGG